MLDLGFDDRRNFAQLLVQFAFNESKGRRAEFELEGEVTIVKVTDRPLSETDLKGEAESIRTRSRKPAVVLSASARQSWTVRGWATAA
jgi:hypothetical protein